MDLLRPNKDGGKKGKEKKGKEKKGKEKNKWREEWIKVKEDKELGRKIWTGALKGEKQKPVRLEAIWSSGAEPPVGVIEVENETHRKFTSELNKLHETNSNYCEGFLKSLSDLGEEDKGIAKWARECSVVFDNVMQKKGKCMLIYARILGERIKAREVRGRGVAKGTPQNGFEARLQCRSEARRLLKARSSLQHTAQQHN